jgi:hypothetical protein
MPRHVKGDDQADQYGCDAENDSQDPACMKGRRFAFYPNRDLTLPNPRYSDCDQEKARNQLPPCAHALF